MDFESVCELRATYNWRNRISDYCQTRGQHPLPTDPAKARGTFYQSDNPSSLFQMGRCFSGQCSDSNHYWSLIHHSRVFQITGSSYGMKNYKLAREQRSKKITPDDLIWSTSGKNINPLFLKPVRTTFLNQCVQPAFPGIYNEDFVETQ